MGERPRSARLAAAGAWLAVAVGLSACSWGIPSLMGDTDDMATGSVAPKGPAVLDRSLEPEDLRRARAALATALDPQGNARPVKWDNPDTGTSGAITADGSPFVESDLVCRHFVATVVGRLAAARALKGTACKPSADEWEIRAVRPWRKTG